MNTSITSSDDGYLDICKEAAINKEVFNTFKSSPKYRGVLEHARYEHGLEHLSIIYKQTPEFLAMFDKFFTNDKYGSPIKEFYPNPQEAGNFVCSPTTLQYIKVLSDLKQLYGNLNDWNIVEIGAGYGGQCKIINDCFIPMSYMVLDLLEPLNLINKYLSKFNIKIMTWNANTFLDFPESLSYDLAISNFAFSEILKSQQNIYIKYILNNCKHGYLTCNQTFTKKWGCDKTYTMEELKEKIKHDVKILPDISTEHPLNYIMTW